MLNCARAKNEGAYRGGGVFTVVGRGGKSFLSDPGSGLRVGRAKEKNMLVLQKLRQRDEPRKKRGTLSHLLSPLVCPLEKRGCESTQKKARSIERCSKILFCFGFHERGKLNTRCDASFFCLHNRGGVRPGRGVCLSKSKHHVLLVFITSAHHVLMVSRTTTLKSSRDEGVGVLSWVVFGNP